MHKAHSPPSPSTPTNRVRHRRRAKSLEVVLNNLINTYLHVSCLHHLIKSCAL